MKVSQFLHLSRTPFHTGSWAQDWEYSAGNNDIPNGILGSDSKLIVLQAGAPVFRLSTMVNNDAHHYTLASTVPLLDHFPSNRTESDLKAMSLYTVCTDPALEYITNGLTVSQANIYVILLVTPPDRDINLVCFKLTHISINTNIY